MNKKSYLGSAILAIFISFGIFSCSKNNGLDSLTQELDKTKVDKGDPIEIGLSLIGANKKNNLYCPYSREFKTFNGTDGNLCPKPKDDSEIYAIRIWKKSALEASGEFMDYAYGLFTKEDLGDMKFMGYNLEEYRIESTVIKKGTGHGLYSMATEEGLEFFAPFQTLLAGKFIYGVNYGFLPTDYLCDMKTCKSSSSTNKEYNHAELNRFYGIVDSFIPRKSKKEMEVIIDMYRVSFDLVFEAVGQELMDNQRVTVTVNTGELPDGKSELYHFVINGCMDKMSSHKIIAFGLDDDTEHETYYNTIHKDVDYMQSYKAIAILETFNEEGEIIDIQHLGKTNNLEVQRNHKTTYTIDIPELNSDIKIGFKFKDSEWIDDEAVPFPRDEELQMD